MAPTATSLNTNDVFVLKSPSSLFVWKGKGATEEELTAAGYVVEVLGGDVTEVAETEESGEGGGGQGGKRWVGL